MTLLVRWLSSLLVVTWKIEKCTSANLWFPLSTSTHRRWCLIETKELLSESCSTPIFNFSTISNFYKLFRLTSKIFFHLKLNLLDRLTRSTRPISFFRSDNDPVCFLASATTFLAFWRFLKTNPFGNLEILFAHEVCAAWQHYQQPALHFHSWPQYCSRYKIKPVPCESLDSQEFSRVFFEISLLDLDLESFLFHFHFSISISSHFYFTFIPRSRSQVKKFHLHFLKRVNGIFLHFSLLDWPKPTLACLNMASGSKPLWDLKVKSCTDNIIWTNGNSNDGSLGFEYHVCKATKRVLNLSSWGQRHTYIYRLFCGNSISGGT